MAKEKKLTTSAAASEGKNKWWDLEFEVDRMQLYHKKRYTFFKSLRKTIVFFALIYNSAVIYSTINHFPTMLIIGSIFMIVLFAFDITFNLSDQEYKHHDLYNRYHFLLTRIESDKKNKELSLNRFRKEYKLIELDQPEIFRALGFWCHNQVTIAKKVSEEYLYDLSFLQRILMNWLQFPHIQPKNLSK